MESNHLPEIVNIGGWWLGYDLGNKHVKTIGGRYWTLKDNEKSSELLFIASSSLTEFSLVVMSISPKTSMFMRI